MRRIYWSTITVAILVLLAFLVVSSAPATAGPQEAALSGAIIQGGTKVDVQDGTLKVPPPADRPGTTPPDTSYQPQACVEPVVNVSVESGNQSESAILINPTNTQNLVAFSNEASVNNIFRAYSFDGGTTWTRGSVATGVACCDGQAVFDTYGNLFLVYINGSVNQINVISSTDGGVTFTAPLTVGSGSIDQPSIAVGAGSVWVDWNQSGSMRARGAPVTGLGVYGPFAATQTPPSASGSFGGIAVGPGGKVMIVYQNPTGGQGPATIYANVDPDGLGPSNFGSQITVTTTNVGGFDYIPAQSGRSVDAESGLVWDSTGGPYNGRVYMVYTEEIVNESNDMDIYVRTSDNDGTTWSAPVRVNDDPSGPIRSQFLPYIALDRTSGTVAVSFHDARNDDGVPGSGGTNNTPNDDSEYYATYTTDGGATWAPNQRLSGGFSNADDAGNGIDYGDYVANDAYAGRFVGMWADNANCDGTNANGTLHQFDLYMGSMSLQGGGTATPTPTGTPPTSTPTNTSTLTSTSTRTPSPSPTVCGVVLAEGFESGTLGAFTSVVPTCVPGGCGWAAQAASPHSGSFSAFAPDVSNISDQQLTLVSAVVPVAGSQLTFWHDYAFEFNGSNYYDGGVLEASTNGGSTWADMGANIISGGYGGTVSTCCNNPLASRQAWVASSSGYVQSVVDLSPYAGQNLLVRFREGTDSSVSATGWRIDDIIITGACSTGTVTVTPTDTNTPTSVPTNTPTNAPTNTPTITGTPTNSPTGTVPTSTNTTIPTSTDTPGTPTSTPTGTLATSTSTSLATNTPVLPTETDTPVVPPTDTGTPVVPPTDTAVVPPTDTALVPPTSTDTPGVPTATPTSCPMQFTDVLPDNTFYTYIRCLACRGIINGYSTGCETGNPCFRPGNLVTRGQLSKIVSNSAGFNDDPGLQMFQDVPAGSTFYAFINRLAIRNIVTGYPCGSPGEPCVGPDNLPYFRPNANITRGQLSKIVSEAAGYNTTPGAQQFEDVLPGSTFYDYIWRLTDLGIMNGYPCGSPGEPCVGPDNLPYFRPGSNATRGQASKIVANTFYPNCYTPSDNKQ